MLSDVKKKIQEWIVSLFIKAIQSCSGERDRTEIISILVLAREVLRNSGISGTDKIRELHRLINSKKIAGMIFRSIVTSVKNYKDSDLPLAVKIAIPVTLTAAVVIGGQGAGIAAFGGAVGMPVLILIFIGTAGVTAIIEAFSAKSESRDYISAVIAIIAKDEILRRTKKAVKDAMTAEPAEPEFFDMPDEENALREKLAKMDPYDFERHVMSFFQKNGMLAWATKKSNDMGVDGFARHPQGLIVVQCKRYAADIPVGRADIQQFKGVIEENGAWRGYFVTTGYFTKNARENASMNDKIILIDMDNLVKWHLNGFSIS